MNGLSLQVNPEFDWFALTLTFGAAVLVLIVAGVAPAIVSTRDIRSAMASEGGTTAGRWRGRRALIALQVGVSVLLVMLASAFVTQMRRESAVDLGIDLDRLAVAEIDFSGQGYDETQIEQIANDVLLRLRRPDVEAASVSSGLPVSFRSRRAGLRAGTTTAFVDVVASTPQIGRTLGLSLVEGRMLDERDGGGTAVVLSRRAAIALFGEESAVGRPVTIERQPMVGQTPRQPEILTVTGVVSDTETQGNAGVAYVPFARPYDSRLVFSARTAGEPESIVGALREAIAAAEPHLAIAQIGVGTDVAGPGTRLQRIFAGMAGLLGMFALMLALAGLYGVMAHAVASRTREVGLRVALGATAGRIQRMIIREGLSPVVSGLVGGMFAAVLAGMGLRATLRGLELPFDVSTLLLIACLFLAAGLAACYLPARRASRVDPNAALKSL